jgi:hypothetical protein
LGLCLRRTGLIRRQSARGGYPSFPTPTADLHTAGSHPSLVRGRSPTLPNGARLLPAQIIDGCAGDDAELEEQEAQRQEEQEARCGRSRGATMGGEGDTVAGGAGGLVTCDSAAMENADTSIFLPGVTVASQLRSSLGASSRGGCPCNRTRRRLPTMPTTGSHYRPHRELLPPALPSGRSSLLPNRTSVASSARASRGRALRQAEQKTTTPCPGKSSSLPPPKSNRRHSNLPHLTSSTLHHPMPVTMPPIVGI